MPDLDGDGDSLPGPFRHSAPEQVPLQLPSTLPLALQQPGLSRLSEIEQQLRLAQAEDALVDLRRLLRINMSLMHYKKTQVGSSQRSSTRARALMSRFQDKIHRSADCYRRAYEALSTLDPGGGWNAYLYALKNEDIKGLGKAEDESESWREVSWIWVAGRTNGHGAALENSEALGGHEDGRVFNRSKPPAYSSTALANLHRCTL